MANQNVTTDVAAMETAANHVDTVNASLDSEIARVRTIVAGSEGNWKGSAAATFVNVMNDYDEKSRQLHQVLAEIGDQIRQNGVGYSETEQANQSALNALGASGELGTPGSSLNI